LLIFHPFDEKPPYKICIKHGGGYLLADVINCAEVYINQVGVSILWGSICWHFDRNEMSPL